MTIISKAYTEETVEYYLSCLTHRNGGYEFECDENGVVDESKMSAGVVENYRKCLNGEIPLIRKPFVNTVHRRYRHPAIGRCECCGAEVELHGDNGYGIDCPNEACDAIYNVCGQRLAPRSEWHEFFQY